MLFQICLRLTFGSFNPSILANVTPLRYQKQLQSPLLTSLCCVAGVLVYLFYQQLETERQKLLRNFFNDPRAEEQMQTDRPEPIEHIVLKTWLIDQIIIDQSCFHVVRIIFSCNYMIRNAITISYSPSNLNIVLVWLITIEMMTFNSNLVSFFCHNGFVSPIVG